MSHSSTQTGADAWTTRKLLAWMSDAFTRNKLDSPRLFAELLLSHVLGCDRLKLYMDADRPASELSRVVSYQPDDGPGRRATLHWVLDHVQEHEIHHRAQLNLYLRLMGIQPPSI